MQPANQGCFACARIAGRDCLRRHARSGADASEPTGSDCPFIIEGPLQGPAPPTLQLDKEKPPASGGVTPPAGGTTVAPANDLGCPLSSSSWQPYPRQKFPIFGPTEFKRKGTDDALKREKGAPKGAPDGKKTAGKTDLEKTNFEHVPQDQSKHSDGTNQSRKSSAAENLAVKTDLTGKGSAASGPAEKKDAALPVGLTGASNVAKFAAAAKLRPTSSTSVTTKPLLKR